MQMIKYPYISSVDEFRFYLLKLAFNIQMIFKIDCGEEKVFVACEHFLRKKIICYEIIGACQTILHILTLSDKKLHQN